MRVGTRHVIAKASSFVLPIASRNCTPIVGRVWRQPARLLEVGRAMHLRIALDCSSSTHPARGIIGDERANATLVLRCLAGELVGRVWRQPARLLEVGRAMHLRIASDCSSSSHRARGIIGDERANATLVLRCVAGL